MLNPKIRMALIMKTIPNEDLQDEDDQKRKYAVASAFVAIC